MAMTGTATECERGWKDWGNVVSLRRSTLHHDRATKLVKLYHHMHKRHARKQRKALPQAPASADIIVVDADDTQAAANTSHVPHSSEDDTLSCDDGHSDAECDLQRTTLASEEGSADGP